MRLVDAKLTAPETGISIYSQREGRNRTATHPDAFPIPYYLWLLSALPSSLGEQPVLALLPSLKRYPWKSWQARADAITQNVWVINKHMVHQHVAIWRHWEMQYRRSGYFCQDYAQQNRVGRAGSRVKAERWGNWVTRIQCTGPESDDATAGNLCYRD